jgi:hypothetical protein
MIAIARAAVDQAHPGAVVELHHLGLDRILVVSAHSMRATQSLAVASPRMDQIAFASALKQ